MLENLRERLHRWFYGCDHEWEEYGAEFFEDDGPKLDLNGVREIYVRKFYKMTKCKKCGERGGKRVQRIEEKTPNR